MPVSGLSQSTRRAASLQLAIRLISIVALLAQQIIIARIVDPSVFGLMNLCLLTYGLLLVITETGISGSIILEREVGQNELNFAWTIQVIRGVVLSGSLWIISPLVSSFFDQPTLTDLLRVLAIIPLVDGITSPMLLSRRRELSYGAIGLLQMTDTILRLVLSIALALLWGNAWALVVPLVVSSFVRSGLSFLLAPCRPRFHYDTAIASRFMNYGRWALANSVLSYFVGQGDNIVVGRMLGVTSLGFYSMAFRIGNMPFSELGNVIAEVAFPALRKAERGLESAFARLYGVTCAVTLPASIGLFVIADDLVSVLLGPDWTTMVIPLKILGLWGGFRSLSVVTAPLFNALGRPDIQTRLSLLRGSILWVLLIPSTMWWGIDGTAMAVLFSSVLTGPVTLHQAYREVKFDIRNIVVLTLLPLSCSFLMALSIFASLSWMSPKTDLFRLVWSIFCGVTIYCGLVLVCVCKLDDARDLRYELMKIPLLSKLLFQKPKPSH